MNGPGLNPGPSTSSTRSLMGNQPARILLLDPSSPSMDYHTLQSICDGLENALCVGANLAGPSRIPLLGIYLLDVYPQSFLPLSCTKGNFPRLKSALDDIRACISDSISSCDSQQTQDQKTCIAQGVSEACGQFRRYASSGLQTSLTCTRLELIIITGHPGNFVHGQFCQLPVNFDLSIIKRILAATITGPLQGMHKICEMGDMGALETEYENFGGMVDTMTLDCDCVSLQKFFYSWFTDSSSGSEHMHMLLPPTHPDENNFIIKCDFSEKMICPFQLPFYDNYNIQTESNMCKHVYPPPSKTLRMAVSLQQFKIIAIVDRDSVCESTLFGTPLAVVPTACWKMDWDALERNQEHFVALCSQLYAKDQVLLAQSFDDPPQALQAQRNNKATTAPKPSGYYILLPSENKTMLIKSVVSQELLLPASQLISTGTLRADSIARVQDSLTQVKALQGLNPLSLNSDLLPALRHISLPRSSIDKSRATKRKADNVSGTFQRKQPPDQTMISDYLHRTSTELHPIVSNPDGTSVATTTWRSGKNTGGTTKAKTFHSF